MIIDKDLKLSALQAVTNSAASENYIDQEKAGDAYGKELYLVARVGTAFANATSMTISLQTDTDSGFSTALETLISSPAIAEASLTENTIVFKTRLPKGLKRYIRGYYTVDGTHNAGTIDLFLTNEIPQA